MDELKKERDELNVKAHLARSEVRDEWEKIEVKWERFNEKTHRVGHEASEVTRDVWTAIKLLSEEIKEGYQRIRQSL
jgi:hypothetical protein